MPCGGRGGGGSYNRAKMRKKSYERLVRDLLSAFRQGITRFRSEEQIYAYVDRLKNGKLADELPLKGTRKKSSKPKPKKKLKGYDPEKPF